MKTHYVPNGIFSPYICFIFGNAKLFTIDVSQKRTEKKKERKEKKKRNA